MRTAGQVTLRRGAFVVVVVRQENPSRRVVGNVCRALDLEHRPAMLEVEEPLWPAARRPRSEERDRR